MLLPPALKVRCFFLEHLAQRQHFLKLMQGIPYRRYHAIATPVTTHDAARVSSYTPANAASEDDNYFYGWVRESRVREDPERIRGVFAWRPRAPREMPEIRSARSATGKHRVRIWAKPFISSECVVVASRRGAARPVKRALATVMS